MISELTFAVQRELIFLYSLDKQTLTSMKYFIVSTLLIALSHVSFCQKKGYFHLYGGVSHSKENDKGLFGISAGARSGKDLAYGIGIAYMNYDKPYFPLTLDLSYLPQTKKITPIAGARAGYGIYNHKLTSVVTVKGGFTGSIFAGVALPGEKVKINLIAGGNRNSFSNKTGFSSISSFENRLFVTLGMLF
jgi:hypothetical protein